MLLSCFTGLAFVDVSTLKKEDMVQDNNGDWWIRKGRIKLMHRRKASSICNIPLLPVPLAILKKYENNPVCIKKGYCLPVPCNQKMNSYLKEIADFCGIKKNITTHVARHTFGSIICLSQGIPIETVSKIMGHKHIKTTQRYAKVTQDKIDRDVDRLNEAIGGKFSLFGIDASPSTIRKDNTRRRVNPSWKQRAIVKQMMEG